MSNVNKTSFCINGAKGVGKTTLSRELVRRGFLAIDTDKALARYVNKITGEVVVKPKRVTLDFKRDHSWSWDREEFLSILEKNKGRVSFFCGGTGGLYKFIDHFRAAFILYVDEEVQRSRLISRYKNKEKKLLQQHGETLCWKTALADIDTAVASTGRFVSGAVQHLDRLERVAIRSDRGVEEIADEILSHVDRMLAE